MKATYPIAALLLAVVFVSGCVSGGVPIGDITGAVVAKEPVPTNQQDIVLHKETVVEFTGTDDYVMTDRFTPEKDNWNYIWSCTGEGEINVYVFPVGSKVMASSATFQDCPGSGSKSVQEGGKEYYIRVRKEGADTWNVMVKQ
ncbi:MAG: hypothetical protein V3V26_01550 [Candidatus Aenigmarchaeota archaeon]